MDELKTIEFGDAGALPKTLRARLKRRRAVRRVRGAAGSAVVVALCVVVGVYVMQPMEQTPSTPGWRAGAMITLDDPMFDALDRGNGGQRVDTRWRAGTRLTDSLVLDL